VYFRKSRDAQTRLLRLIALPLMTSRSHEVNHEVTYEVNHEVTYEVNHEVNHETSHVVHLTRSCRLADIRLGNSVAARDGNLRVHWSTRWQSKYPLEHAMDVPENMESGIFNQE
jgi:hypothetical protein